MHKAFQVAPVVVQAIAKLILAVIEDHTSFCWPIAVIPAGSFRPDAADYTNHSVAAVSFVAALNLYLIAYLNHVR